MRYFSANFPYIFCIWILRIFQCLLQENLQKIVWQFSIFFKLFRDDFYETVCRDGKGGIPVKSRCKCGNPDRDCTEKNSFLQREINEKRNWRESWKIPLVTSSAAAESEMKGRVELFIPYFSSFLMIILMTMCVGMGLGGMGLRNRCPRETVNPSF